MFTFKNLMIITFIAAVGSLLAGIFSIGSTDADRSHKSNSLMIARVGFSFALFIEIIIYINFIN